MLDQSNAEIDDFRVEWVKIVLLITSMPALLDQSNAELDLHVMMHSCGQ